MDGPEAKRIIPPRRAASATSSTVVLAWGCRVLLVALVALVAPVLAACATQALPPASVPFTAVDARVEGSSLQIRYLCAEGMVYSESEQPEEFRSPGSRTGAGLALFVLTPSVTSREPSGGRMSGRRLPLLGPEEYRRLRSTVIDALVPRGPNVAVVVRFQDEEVVLYFDDGGRFRSVLGAPPADVTVVRRLPIEEYLAAAPQTLARLLDEHGIASREVLFSTGDSGADPLPFLYANLDTSTAAFVRVRPLGAAPESDNGPAVPMTWSVPHLVESHTLGLLHRPVTSLMRLVFMVSDAVQDTFDPAWTLALESAEIVPLSESPGMDLDAWEAELDELIGRPSSTGTMSYLIDGGAFFPRLEHAVEAAEESILVRTYIFDNDDYARGFADLLRARAADGVSVRVIMDGLGTLAAGREPPAGLPDGYEDPGSMQAYLTKDSTVEVRTVLNPFFTGDHTKSIVIDGRIAFVGGMNIGREYRYEWHDMMAEVEGPVVAQIADDFDQAWAGSGLFGDFVELLWRLGPRRGGGPPMGHAVRVLRTRPTVSEIRTAQLAALERARSYVYLQNAYLTDDSVLYELVQARRRGVDVRVVIPLRSDRGILTRDNVLAANVLFRNGVRVYIYPGMSHVKAAVYDGWACLGSANVDQLSLRVNRESNIASSAPESVQPLLDALFEVDFRNSPEMQEEFPTNWHDRLWEFVGDYAF